MKIFLFYTNLIKSNFFVFNLTFSTKTWTTKKTTKYLSFSHLFHLFPLSTQKMITISRIPSPRVKFFPIFFLKEPFNNNKANTLYSDYYCYSISSNLCISCYTSTNSYYLLNSNRKCAYNKDLLTNIFYHSIQHYAYGISINLIFHN